MIDFDEEALGEAYNKGLAAEKRGDRDAAADAYSRCLTIDPSDHVGAEIRLAGLGFRDAPPNAGKAYVATLFDQHAEDFEDILVRQLRYRVPELVAYVLRDSGRHFETVLDLGCGTGLAIEALSGRGGTTTGVDLSEEMIRICGEKGIYDRLYVAEAIDFLKSEHAEAAYDLIMATDILPYIGDLNPLFSAASRRLEPGGSFAFSTETMTETELAGRPFAVGTAQRFHHGEAYLRELLPRHGFSLEYFEAITVRLQDAAPAPGHLVVARNMTRHASDAPDR
ncbi:putative methyltransferase protein [Fulvimarina pelagi HTCC2506]|uniref:Putative methyltransferase protein n=1 Tax=Fulvimarina pelagi HTCC2506 TaxID=314231 RepID=Q0G610_9HYPH|nr:methyltransferase domain-containing protein [Fulvimarina pelagi]EAU42904.1 putative methyltransferase protein [Fulvimarina pelagi HTCC2506]